MSVTSNVVVSNDWEVVDMTPNFNEESEWTLLDRPQVTGGDEAKPSYAQIARKLRTPESLVINGTEEDYFPSPASIQNDPEDDLQVEVESVNGPSFDDSDEECSDDFGFGYYLTQRAGIKEKVVMRKIGIGLDKKVKKESKHKSLPHRFVNTRQRERFWQP